jgi:DNA polymerase V
LFRPDSKIARELPVYEPGITQTLKANPEQSVEESLYLNGYLISHPSATFLVKVTGEAAPTLGITPGDMLVVDQAVPTRDGKMVVGILHNKFVVKFLKIKGSKLFFAAETADGKDVEVTSSVKFNLWGVVTYIIHKPELPPEEQLSTLLTS